MPTGNEFAEINWDPDEGDALGGLSYLESMKHKDNSFIWLKLWVYTQCSELLLLCFL